MIEVPSSFELMRRYEKHPYVHACITTALLRKTIQALDDLDNGDLYGVRLSLTMALEDYQYYDKYLTPADSDST